MTRKILILFCLVLISGRFEVQSQGLKFKHISNKNLIAFWDFDEPVNGGWNSVNSKSYFLAFGEAKVGQVFDHDLDRNVADFQDGQWLSIPRAQLADLDISGKNAALTVIALVKKESEKNWQAIAGVWDESRSKRQYYMFLNASSKTHQEDMKRYPSQGRLHGHISALGGKTPGQVAWISYASSKEPVLGHTWVWIAMTYNGKEIKVFVDGELQKDPQMNPFNYPEGIYDGELDGADFTVGANSVANRITNQFIGRMAFLGVFKKALTTDELQKLQSQLYKINSKKQ
jgi:hypothetical protein